MGPWLGIVSHHRLACSTFSLLLLLTTASGCSRWRRHSNSSPASQSCASLKAGPVNYNDHISEIAERYCTSCHSGVNAMGGLDLSTLDDASVDFGYTQKWQRALLRVEDKSMPPAGDVPSDCEVQALRQWLTAGAPKDNDEAILTLEERELQMCSQPAATEVKDLNRLSKTEYINSLQYLLGADAMKHIEPFIENLPQDDLAGGYPNMAWNISASHVEAYSSVASAAGAYFSDDQTRMKVIAPCWNKEALSAECISFFVDNFTTGALRRPIESAERRDLLALFSPAAIESGTALKEFFDRILLSPYFLYKIEVSGDEIENKTLRLDDFAIASRLSFLAWESSPDQELLRAAAAGELSTDDGFQQQVNRVFSDTLAKAAARNFYGYWLNLKSVPKLAYSADFLAGIVPGQLWHDAVEEVQSFVDDTIWDQGGDFSQLMNSNSGAIRTKNLADIYGVSSNQMTGERFAFPEGRRGILSRVALLVQNGDETIPIKRGSFVLQRIFCEELKQPDPISVPVDAFTPPKHNSDLSNRARWEEKTAPAQCQGCHRRLNPLGFAMESYDSLGRLRDAEFIVASDGSIGGKRKINSEVSLKFGIDSKIFHGAPDLIEAIGTLPKAEECFARQWFRFSEKRRETKTDRCEIIRLRRALTGSEGKPGSIRDMFAAKAKLGQFRTKSLPAEGN